MKKQLNERENQILEILAEHESAGVSDLAEQLGVSLVTVRSALSALEDRGYLVRTWGGASAAVHPRILDRKLSMSDEKKRIARAAADLVEDGDTIMVEAGTTTAMVVSFLLGRRDITLVSNSTLVLPSARTNPGLTLTTIGGIFRPETESFVGPVAREQLTQYHVRRAFIGTDGFSLSGGISTHLVEGAEIVRTMAQCADEVVLVADSSKYGKTGFVRVLPVSAIDRIITDSGIVSALSTDDQELMESGHPSIQLV
ncbi:MAG: DeoR/GlpR transcriptional regulator [Spirochaetaceae bacterium]|nr:MAG: DeoR/GlpR transcriptional regulator [Spirochaetaceae bacterium]